MSDAKKILLVEDEEAVVFALKEKLDLLSGVEIITARDGEIGLEKAIAEKPDLILLDIIMPKMDGIEMLKKLREDDWGKTARVIILSNLSHVKKEKEAKDLGVKHYLIKTDWKIEEVMDVIKKNL